jgi:hypothetical protein
MGNLAQIIPQTIMVGLGIASCIETGSQLCQTGNIGRFEKSKMAAVKGTKT